MLAAFIRTALLLLVALAALAQSEVPPIVGDYWAWRETVDPLPQGEDPVARFEAKLRADGFNETDIASMLDALRRGLVDEEGEFYDGIYKEGPNLDFAPNRLLVEAVERLPPGDALDVGVGQGRNGLYLAQRGWRVTGFDPSAEGLRQAHENAAKAGVEITTEKVGAEYFDYGHERWDLIDIIYPIEKFSVFRVREALKPGGIVVIEAPHIEVAPYPNHYASNELLEIFQGFRILKYEDTLAIADWGQAETRLVRLIAQKPR
jgi:2-polyprenyl-3-methyl-5-hydroxy-6-metoxy-1,4-benzoquinol methylase